MVIPIGSATAIAMKEVRSVPLKSGRIPKCFSANSGVHSLSVRKETKETSLKKTMDSEIRTHSIAIVVKTDIVEQSTRKI